jgi:hypothetical protein
MAESARKHKTDPSSNFRAAKVFYFVIFKLFGIFTSQLPNFKLC